MYMFADAPQKTQQAVFIPVKMSPQAHFKQARQADPIPETPRFDHEFSRVPLHGKQAAAAQGTTILPPGGWGEDEPVTVPAGKGSTAPTKTPPPPTFCKCTPTSASIKNAKKYTSGKLYGHEFDFVVDLKYEKLGSKATKNEDCTFEWWEKCSDPPAWQTKIKKNTWNNMYALYPTSPTFNGWNNRSKPCPGTETATVHDPPATSVDLPARTLWFDLKVKGGGVTKSASATQVLVPNGKGGIKTQTFTIT